MAPETVPPAGQDRIPDTAASEWVQIDAEVHWREPRTPAITFCGEVISGVGVPVGKPDDQDICERCWNLGCPR